MCGSSLLTMVQVAAQLILGLLHLPTPCRYCAHCSTKGGEPLLCVAGTGVACTALVKVRGRTQLVRSKP